MELPFICDLAAIFPERLRGRDWAASEMPAALARLAGPVARLRADHAAAALPHWALPYRRDDLAALAPLADHLKTKFADVVVLATGGSSLGGRALLALTEGRTPGARLTFCDNLDPAEMDALLRGLDLARTAFLVISKSGGTGETLTQVLVCLDAL
ncbi:MAG: glucose-6-phosphate isomerase, partial [Proteobacteria bacterium]|nr:glucose-6-phosphate isomerase [Pseudomonadota bacterium]